MAWKIYFVAIVAFCLWGYSDIFSEYPAAYDYIDIPFTVITMTGLYGYAFKKCNLYPGFWKLWLYIAVGWDSFYTFYTIRYDIKNDPELIELINQNVIAVIIIAVIGFGIFLPAYIALYLYGFRSKDLWNNSAS